MRSLPAILIFASVLCAASPARATSWRPPAHPLTVQEKVDFAVSQSKLIGVGTAEAVHDSLDEEGTLWAWVSFRPDRWLKGDGGEKTVRLYFPTYVNSWRGMVEGWVRGGPTRCILFANPLTDGRLALSLHPEFYGDGGVVRLTAFQGAESAVANGIKRMSLEGLASNSALIVVGRAHRSSSPCTIGGRRIYCSEVLVDSVVTGTLPTSQLRVYTTYGPVDPDSTTIFALKAGEGGAYEVVGVLGGAIAVRRDLVPALGASLTQTVSRLRAAAHPRQE